MHLVAGKPIACIQNPLFSVFPSDKPKARSSQHSSIGSHRKLLDVPTRFTRTRVMENFGLPIPYPGEVAVQEAQPDTTLRICHDPTRGRHLRRRKLFLDF